MYLQLILYKRINKFSFLQRFHCLSSTNMFICTRFISISAQCLPPPHCYSGFPFPLSLCMMTTHPDSLVQPGVCDRIIAEHVPALQAKT